MGRKGRTQTHRHLLIAQQKIKEMKSKGYKIIIYYLKLATVELAIERIKLCVAQGGHNIAEKDIRRRFEKVGLILLDYIDL